MRRAPSQLILPLAAVIAVSTAFPVGQPALAVGRAFSFGDNYHGRTAQGVAIGSTPVATPIDASHLGGRAVKQADAGYEHGLLLTEDGSVFSFGHNGQGRTGLGIHTGDTLAATPIDATHLGGRAIVQVAAGESHSLLLAEDGAVFSCGYNGSGQLGVGRSFGPGLTPTPIDLSNLGGRAVTQVAAGSDHSLLLTEDGNVFSFGSNLFGELGRTATSGSRSVATPIDASNLGGRAITQIAAGDRYSLLLAEDGRVFSFGHNYAGQTGLAEATGSTPIATPIDASNLNGRAVTQLAVGSNHSLLLTEDGSVFSFGYSYYGELGLGTAPMYATRATPIDASNLGGRAIVQIAAGEDHSLLLADDGAVFSMGANYVGQTGVGTNVGLTLAAAPIDMSNLGGRVVTQMTAGGHFSLLIAVPEPNSSILAGAAALALLRFRRVQSAAGFRPGVAPRERACRWNRWQLFSWAICKFGWLDRV